MKRISAFEILNHGPEHGQYFQGCGTYGTDFQHVITGAADTLREALEDALNMFADNSQGAPFDTAERLVREFMADVPKAELDADCHADHDKVCAECDAPVVYIRAGLWVHSEDDVNDTNPTHPVEPTDACEDCEVHSYVSIRFSVEDVTVYLDNEDRTDGMVLVTTECGQDYAEAVDDDRTIAGSTWEDSGDFSPYTIFPDDAALVTRLRADGYVLDLRHYVAPEDHEISCIECKADFMLNTAVYRENDGALLCPACGLKDRE